jgi:hypothetical protein
MATDVQGGSSGVWGSCRAAHRRASPSRTVASAILLSMRARVVPGPVADAETASIHRVTDTPVSGCPARPESRGVRSVAWGGGANAHGWFVLPSRAGVAMLGHVTTTETMNAMPRGPASLVVAAGDGLGC